MSASNALVSVIVPTRNSARFLRACLESVKRQTYRPIEIIVVDNNSTDATAAIAREYTTRVFSCGPERSAQVNYGVRKAAGTYVYKVDSDFVLDAEVIESCVQEIARGFDAIVVHNSPDTRLGWIARIRKFEVDMYKYDITHSAARFIKKSVYTEIGGFDESVTAGEDYDFQNRLNAADFKTGYVAPEALHLGEPTSFWKHMVKYYEYGTDFVIYARRNPSASRRQLRFVRAVYLKNWRLFAAHPLRAVIFLVYHACKFAFGGAGYLVGTYQTRRARRMRNPFVSK
jgi:glycosyltransferase involved in cell wall biosynthesis